MSRNLIIVIALAVIAVLAVAWLFLMGPLSSSDNNEAEAEAKSKEIALFLENAGVSPDASHVTIEPFNISIIQSGKILGALFVSMELLTGNRDLNAGVVKARPKLRDAYLQALSGYVNRQLDPNRPVNVSLLKRLLQKATNRVLGETAVAVVISGAHISEPFR
jgi:flagellar basal body-associated protein FliL